MGVMRDYMFAYTTLGYGNTPHTIVLWVFLSITLVAMIACFFTPYWNLLWKKNKGEVDSNGMKRLLIFNKQPYLIILFLSLSIIASIIASTVVLFIVGGVVFLLLWLIKMVLWALVIIGWICAIGGLLAGFTSEKKGCLAVPIGILIIVYQKNILNAGEACVEAGTSFFESLNLWSFCQILALEYWKTFLLIAMSPIAIGIGLAFLILLIAAIFRGIEALTTRKYNMQHPCPFCHNPSEPAVYLSENLELPVKLRPGLYGLFHITHPQTGEKMPTMIFNGRDKLMRRCPHCTRTISYKVGVEKHVAFVGLPESGKTCLAYRFIGNLMKKYPSITFTDEINAEAKRIILGIKNGEEQELASKTAVSDIRRSIQILVPGKLPLPYHVFINDVGGELFTNSGVDFENVQFFKDVESIVVLIDPFTMDFSDYKLSSSFLSWYDKNNESFTPVSCGKVRDVFQTVKTMSYQFMHKPDKVHMNVVLVKIDQGYVEKEIVGDELKIRDFISNQLGLLAEISDIEASYASLHFYAVSSLKNWGVDRIIEGIINELNIKID